MEELYKELDEINSEILACMAEIRDNMHRVRHIQAQRRTAVGLAPTKT